MTTNDVPDHYARYHVCTLIKTFLELINKWSTEKNINKFI